jgi:hypothetical protein
VPTEPPAATPTVPPTATPTGAAIAEQPATIEPTPVVAPSASQTGAPDASQEDPAGDGHDEEDRKGDKGKKQPGGADNKGKNKGKGAGDSDD